MDEPVCRAGTETRGLNSLGDTVGKGAGGTNRDPSTDMHRTAWKRDS